MGSSRPKADKPPMRLELRARGQSTEDRRWRGPSPGRGRLLISDLRSLALDPMPQASRTPRISPTRRRAQVAAGPLTAALAPLSRLGDHSVRAPPDPIPNSAVKPHRAQGTALLRVEERVVARSSHQSPQPHLRSPTLTTRFPIPKPTPSPLSHQIFTL
jgi:hypothetical protein